MRKDVIAQMERRAAVDTWLADRGISRREGCSAVRRKIIQLVFNGRCLVCGYSDVRALQIDHVNGDGYKRMGWAWQLWDLIHHPARYQCLCANCNWIKRIDECGWAREGTNENREQDQRDLRPDDLVINRGDVTHLITRSKKKKRERATVTNKIRSHEEIERAMSRIRNARKARAVQLGGETAK